MFMLTLTCEAASRRVTRSMARAAAQGGATRQRGAQPATRRSKRLRGEAADPPAPSTKRARSWVWPHTHTLGQSPVLPTVFG